MEGLHPCRESQRSIVCCSDSMFSLCLFSRGAAWPRSPWWKRPGWSLASSCCSPSSACSSSWWRWPCPPPSSASASAHTSTWRRSWQASGLTPAMTPPQPIRLAPAPTLCCQPIRRQNNHSALCHWWKTHCVHVEWIILWKCVWRPPSVFEIIRIDLHPMFSAYLFEENCVCEPERMRSETCLHPDLFPLFLQSSRRSAPYWFLQGWDSAMPSMPLRTHLSTCRVNIFNV